MRVFLGLNQLGVWLGMINVERMIHPWQWLGSGRFRGADAAAAAALSAASPPEFKRARHQVSFLGQQGLVS